VLNSVDQPAAFRFALLQSVIIASDGTQGTVLARLDQPAVEHKYLVRIPGDDGRAIEGWRNDSALAPVHPSCGVFSAAEPAHGTACCGEANASAQQVASITVDGLNGERLFTVSINAHR
jgi:hypothetical protein